jgi:glutaredoxin
VHDENPNLLYSFFDERGGSRLVSRAADVPPEMRARVLVVDVSQDAATRKAHRVLTFANLNERLPDGSYAVVPVSRYDASRGQSFEESLPVSSSNEVLVYSAEWCGFCKKAKAWLQHEGVPFIERDVERQPGASRELEQKLKRAQLRGGGVPVIDWRGTMVVGFDQGRLSSLLDAERGSVPSAREQGP